MAVEIRRVSAGYGGAVGVHRQSEWGSSLSNSRARVVGGSRARPGGIRCRLSRLAVTLPLAAVLALSLPFAAAMALTTPAAATPVSPSPTPKPLTIDTIDAKSWVVVEAETGQVLAAHDPHRRLPPASTLKVLTALTLLPRLQLDSTYVGSKQDVAEGNSVDIQPGLTYKVSDLFHGLLMPSANDAANALANSFGGRPATVAAMNAEAARIHANDTVAKSPSGLDEAGQVTSAFDLAATFREAMHNAAFRQMLKIKVCHFPGPRIPGPLGKLGKREAPIEIATLNPLLRANYPGLVGGKTGYTTNAGRTFVVAAKRGNRTIIVSLMDYTTATEESADVLLKWGFGHAGLVPPVGQIPNPDPLTDRIVPQPATQGKPAAAANPANNAPAPPAAPGPPATSGDDADEGAVAAADPPASALVADTGQMLLPLIARGGLALIVIIVVIAPIAVALISRARRRSG